LYGEFGKNEIRLLRRRKKKKCKNLKTRTMNKILRLIFYTILLFSIYHLIRDLLTNAGVHNYIVDFAHRPKTLWCGKICPWVTVPPEIFNIIVSTIVLKRNNVGALGFLVLIQVPIWIVLITLVP
jgi:hypothetical protein